MSGNQTGQENFMRVCKGDAHGKQHHLFYTKFPQKEEEYFIFVIQRTNFHFTAHASKKMGIFLTRHHTKTFAQHSLKKKGVNLS